MAMKMIICSPENVDDLKSESSEEKNSVQTKVFGVKTVYGSTRQLIWMEPVISYLSRRSEYGDVQVLSVVILSFRFIERNKYLSRATPNLNIKDSIIPGDEVAM